VAYADGRWHVRDLNSLNGTRVNSVTVEGERELAPNDEVHLGHTHLIFVDHMGQLPDLPMVQADADLPSIKKRLGHTRFLTPVPPLERQETQVPEAHEKLNRELALLYRLA